MSDDERHQEILRRLVQISDRQKAIAQSVADVALAVNFEGRTARERHSEAQGLLLGLLSDNRKQPERKRRDSGDDTNRFKLPGGEDGDAVQLTRRTQRKILRWVILALFAAMLHVAQWLFHAWPALHHAGH